jgi:uncharacterized protein YdaU (DUF1376 family)
MSGKPPAFQLYAADFYMDTDDWSVEELGIYTRLLLSQWVNGDLPEEPERLARIAKCSLQRFLSGWRIVQKKFTPAGEGRIQNRRLEQTRQGQLHFREQQRNKGILSGEKRRKQMNRGSNPSQAKNQPFSLQSASSLFPSEMKERVRRESWDGFVAMRSRIKKPLTERAVELVGLELAKLLNQGYDPNAVLDQSTLKNYRDVYPVRDNGGTNGTGRSSGSQRTTQGHTTGERGLGDDAPYPDDFN